MCSARDRSCSCDSASAGPRFVSSHGAASPLRSRVCCQLPKSLAYVWPHHWSSRDLVSPLRSWILEDVSKGNLSGECAANIRTGLGCSIWESKREDEGGRLVRRLCSSCLLDLSLPGRLCGPVLSIVALGVAPPRPLGTHEQKNSLERMGSRLADNVSWKKCRGQRHAPNRKKRTGALDHAPIGGCAFPSTCKLAKPR